jgi:hypothetical protein
LATLTRLSMKQIIIHRNIPRDCYLKLSVKRGGSLD